MLIRVPAEADPRLEKKAWKYATLKRRRKSFYPAVGSGFVALVAFLFSPADGSIGAANLLVIGYFALVSMAFFVQLSTVRSALRKAAKKAALDTRPTQYVLTEERFAYDRPGEDLSIAWTLIGDVREYHDMWLIHRWDEAIHWYVPKLGMPEPEVAEFRMFLATRHQLIAAMHPQAA